jgi:sugar transferase (PEP-CTERM system associated)
MEPPCSVIGDTKGIPKPTAAAMAGRRESFSFSETMGRAQRSLGRTLATLTPSTWMLLDIALLMCCVYGSFYLIPPPNGFESQHVTSWQALTIFSFALTISSGIFGLYETKTLSSLSTIATRLLLASTSTIVISYAIIYVVMYVTVGRRMTALSLCSFVLLAGAIRVWANQAVTHLSRRLLVVGARDLYDRFLRAQLNQLLPGYQVVGYGSPNVAEEPDPPDAAYLGESSKFVPHLEELGVTDIVVGNAAARQPEAMTWITPSLQHGCRVISEAIFFEKAAGQILLDAINPTWFLFADLKVYCEEHARLKRVTDLLTALVGLILSAPLWPLIALVIKLNDGGPVFYAQDRVGHNGKVFRLYKFRTMQPDAERGKSVWACKGDPRVTRVGRFLRRSRLDELPQLYNILVGEMSIVGPRPERPDIVQELCAKIPYYAERHLVKPGLTGWAQINFRYGASVEDSKQKLQFDLYYLKHMSFELDLTILFRTLGTFLRGSC